MEEGDTKYQLYLAWALRNKIVYLSCLVPTFKAWKSHRKHAPLQFH